MEDKNVDNQQRLPKIEDIMRIAKEIERLSCPLPPLQSIK